MLGNLQDKSSQPLETLDLEDEQCPQLEEGENVEEEWEEELEEDLEEETKCSGASPLQIPL